MRTIPTTHGTGTHLTGTTTTRTTVTLVFLFGIMVNYKKENTEMFNVTYDDMYKAYTDCRRRKKNTPGAKQFETYALYNIIKLVDEINNAKYKLRPSTCFVVEYPTAREVFCAAFRDRIVQHFVYNEINPLIEKKLIHDTCSCRVGKGTDYAIKRLQRFVRRETNNYTHEAYYLKIDLSGFFMAIDRDILLNDMLDLVNACYQGKYKEVLLYLLPIIIKTDITTNAVKACNPDKWKKIPPRKTLFGNQYGLAIGNITSQVFANCYLNDIDHWLKSRHKSVVRYVDDIVVVCKDKQHLSETKELLKVKLSGLHQKLNEHKTIIRNVSEGIKFLGVVVHPYYTDLAKSRINRLYYTSSLIKTYSKFLCSANSRKGMFKRYHGYKVCKRWYNSLPKVIKDKIKLSANYKFIIFMEENHG